MLLTGDRGNGRNLANSLYELEDWEGVAEAASRALTLDPHHGHTLLILANAYKKLGG